MSDNRTTTGTFAQPAPDDDAERESRHQLLATLLGAYADGEVPTETASQIDAHLLGCVRCRRELDVHRAIRLRLASESIPPASAALRERIIADIASATVPVAVPVAAPVAATTLSAHLNNAWRNASLGARAAVALLAVATLSTIAVGAVRWTQPRTATPTPVTMVALSSLTLFDEVVQDYRRVIATDLPGRSRDLATVRAAMPFPVNALVSPQLRLLAAWTTDLHGEPAAVLAYRWNDKLALQYVVSEQLLFRPANVRRAFADGRHLAAQSGSQTVIAWPASASGELLVADMSLEELASLRATVAGR